jgi:Ala-tRNA(Pro) deacylase
MRVAQFLNEHHVPFQEVLHAPAFTAQKLARFLHISGKQVVKSVLLSGPGGCFLALLPAPAHIDLAGLAAQLGGPVRLATEDEMADHFRDCERGSLTPFGSLYGLTTLLDDSIAPETHILFESESHAVAIRMRCRDFELLERPRRMALSGQ